MCLEDAFSAVQESLVLEVAKELPKMLMLTQTQNQILKKAYEYFLGVYVLCIFKHKNLYTTQFFSFFSFLTPIVFYAELPLYMFSTCSTKRTTNFTLSCIRIKFP